MAVFCLLCFREIRKVVAITPMPAMSGELCVLEPAGAGAASRPLSAAASVEAGSKDERIVADRAPARVIRDTYPTYSAGAGCS